MNEWYGLFGNADCALGLHDRSPVHWDLNALALREIAGVEMHEHMGQVRCKRNCGWWDYVHGKYLNEGLAFPVKDCPICKQLTHEGRTAVIPLRMR